MIERYINKIMVNVKPLTVENIVAFCQTELKKSYSERKLHNLEIARDYVIRNYIKQHQLTSESSEDIPF